MTTQQDAVVQPHPANADDAGWRCVAQPCSAVRRKPSLSWRLRH